LSWAEEVREVVTRRWPKGAEFSLAQVYEFERELQARHPSNAHVRDSIREALQKLRDEGLNEFLDNMGHYRRM
jgi:type II restriction enzyme